MRQLPIDDPTRCNGRVRGSSSHSPITYRSMPASTSHFGPPDAPGTTETSAGRSPRSRMCASASGPARSVSDGMARQDNRCAGRVGYGSARYVKFLNRTDPDPAA